VYDEQNSLAVLVAIEFYGDDLPGDDLGWSWYQSGTRVSPPAGPSGRRTPVCRQRRHSHDADALRAEPTGRTRYYHADEGGPRLTPPSPTC
jgi:hypothetical protein